MTKASQKRPKAGRPPNRPEDKTRQLAIRIKDTDLDDLRLLASESGQSLSAYINDVLQEHLVSKDTA